MRFDIITIFPEMFSALTESGITRRAFEKGQAQIHCWQLRDFTTNTYRTVDDRPYGGGAGMVMSPEPLKKAVLQAKSAQMQANIHDGKVIYLSASGTRLTQQKVRGLMQHSAITLICGRYEGVDQRFIDRYVDEEISIGDFVVSGGELPSMLLLDAMIRLIPGVIEKESIEEESFSIQEGGGCLLEYPHYTRPEMFEETAVPKVLLSGHHADIAAWRLQMAKKRTALMRPDLLQMNRSNIQ